jgi:hypothetical protein
LTFSGSCGTVYGTVYSDISRAGGSGHSLLIVNYFFILEPFLISETVFDGICFFREKKCNSPR